MIGRAAERGFTLVEMLVALTIFSILAAAGVTLLRASVDTQEVVATSLTDLGAAARLRMVLNNDLAQVVVRPTAAAPLGFAGTAAALTLVRAAEPAEQVRGEAGLQAVRWALSGDRLVRTSMGSDGVASAATTPLARDVTNVRFRYRASNGDWRSDWAFAPGEQTLPAAVELIVTRRGQAPVSLVVALPAGPAPRPVPAL